MSLQIVASKEPGFSAKELLSLIALIRVTFNQNFQVQKQSTFVRISSPLFAAEHKKAIIYFTLGNSIPNVPSFEITSASKKMGLPQFAKMAGKLLSTDYFNFKLHCEGPNGFIMELNFEKFVGEKVQHVLIESDSADLSRIFSKAFENYAKEQKNMPFTNDPGSFIVISRLIWERADAQLKSCPLA